jgi:phosphoenolpyruvate carboxylase
VRRARGALDAVLPDAFLRRRAALRVLRAGVDGLAQRFSHSRRQVRVSPELEASPARDEADLPSAPVLRRVHREREPLRTKLGFRRASAVRHARPARPRAGLRDPQELRADLLLVLDGVGSAHVAHGAIRRLLRQVDVFGFHVAALDVRQSAADVQEAACALLPGYRRAGEEQRRRLLRNTG